VLVLLRTVNFTWALNMLPGAHEQGSLTTTPAPTISTSPAVHGSVLRSFAAAMRGPAPAMIHAATAAGITSRRMNLKGALVVLSRCITRFSVVGRSGIPGAASWASLRSLMALRPGSNC